jgi:hypothetical protein
LRTRSPHTTTVPGRPRKPGDQGSVERANHTFKEMLYAFEQKQLMNGETPNWTEGVPYCGASMKGREIHGPGGVSSYQAVYNMPYEDPEMALTSNLRLCSTAFERIQLLRNSNFAKMVQSNNWEHEFEDADESKDEESIDQYWSDSDSINSSEGLALTSTNTVGKPPQALLEVKEPTQSPLEVKIVKAKTSAFRKGIMVPVNEAIWRRLNVEEVKQGGYSWTHVHAEL